MDGQPDKILCSKCRADDVVIYMTPETAICPACCDDHDYVYDSGEHYCQHCGEETPDDWFYCDDDVPLGGYFSSEPMPPIGIPASALDGNAANRHNNPEGWARWVAFCDACGLP